MKKSRGTKTRTANMNLRRDRILETAAEIIAEQGLDHFTLTKLAKRSEVTVPTIHNLIGKKKDIFKQLTLSGTHPYEKIFTSVEYIHLIDSLEKMLDRFIKEFENDEVLTKAALKIAEGLSLLKERTPDSFYKLSQKFAVRYCQNFIEKKQLQGRIPPEILGQIIHDYHRGQVHDWMTGAISISTLRTQMMTGTFVILASDASPEIYKDIEKKLAALS